MMTDDGRIQDTVKEAVEDVVQEMFCGKISEVFVGKGWAAGAGLPPFPVPFLERAGHLLNTIILNAIILNNTILLTLKNIKRQPDCARSVCPSI